LAIQSVLGWQIAMWTAFWQGCLGICGIVCGEPIQDAVGLISPPQNWDPSFEICHFSHRTLFQSRSVIFSARSWDRTMMLFSSIAPPARNPLLLCSVLFSIHPPLQIRFLSSVFVVQGLWCFSLFCPVRVTFLILAIALCISRIS
jgi:hypothetical protein